MLGRRPAGHGSWRIMVGEGPARPAFAVAAAPGFKPLGDKLWRQRLGIEEGEAVGAVQPPVVGGVLLHLDVGVVAADFGHGEAIRAVGIEQRPDPLEIDGDVWVRLVVLVELKVEGACPFSRRRGRIIGQRRVVHAEIDGVETEAVDASVQPELRCLQHRILNRWVVKVKVWLGRQEVVQIVLPAARVPGPGWAAEHGLPVGRRGAVGLCVRPDIPVRLRARPILAALSKPGVSVGGVRIDLVDDDLHAQRVRALEHPIEVVEGSENGIDIAIVRDVIAEVLHRRPEEGRQPHAVHAQGRHMVKMCEHARQVADPVTVGVGETARVDLIDHRAFPPRRGEGC